MSRPGDEFYLGERFRYEGPAFWFGLPTGSQLGFTASAAVLLAILFRMTAGERDAPVPGGLWEHRHGVALLTYPPRFHLAGVAFWMGAETIGGAAILMWVPVAAMTAVHWAPPVRTPVPESEQRTRPGGGSLAHPPLYARAA